MPKSFFTARATLGLVGEEVSLRGLDLLPQRLHVETRALLHRRKIDEGLGEFAALGRCRGE